MEPNTSVSKQGVYKQSVSGQEMSVQKQQRPSQSTTDQFLSLFRAARKVSTPIIVVRTLDPMASIVTLTVKALKKKDKTGAESEPPIILWDIVRGMVGGNKAGAEAVKRLVPNEDDLIQATARPPDALVLAAKLPEGSVLFSMNAHRYLEDPTVVQAVWNLRDPFKRDGSTLVLLSTPGATMPVEIAQDVLVLDEPLPTVTELSGIVTDLFRSSSLEPPAAPLLVKATDALVGLASFPAEQALAMSLALSKINKGKVELDVDSLWERKRQAIEQTPGLSVWRGGDTFDDIGGCDNIKQFLRAVLGGAEPPRVIVFVDEISLLLVS